MPLSHPTNVSDLLLNKETGHLGHYAKLPLEANVVIPERGGGIIY